MSNNNLFNDRSLQDGENLPVFDFESEFGDKAPEKDLFFTLERQARSSFPNVGVSWADPSSGEITENRWNRSTFQHGPARIPTSEYRMSDAGSSNGSEIHYVDQAYDLGFESSPASAPYLSSIPDITFQRRNSLPSDRSLHDTVTHSGDERRVSWAYGQNEQLSDAASSSYHSARHPSFENLTQFATASMLTPYPTGTSQPAYSPYNYSDPNVIQSIPTNVQPWQTFNSPASSVGDFPHLNRMATPGISALLQSTLFLHHSYEPQLNFDPPSEPDLLLGFDVYPSGIQVPEEHTQFNNSQPLADGTGSHPGSSESAEVSTSSRFLVYVPNDSSEASPANTPYHMLPEADSGKLSRNSSKSKLKGEHRVKSVACNYCRSKKNKCIGVSGERCECCTTLNIQCTYSESRRGKYERKSKKGK